MSFAAKKGLIEEVFDDFKEDTGRDYLHWVYDLLFGLEEDEIPTDEFIEGSGEKQLDVVRVEDDIENRRAKIHIVQTKKTGGFSSNAIVLISNGISTIVKTKKADVAKLTNKTLADKIAEIRDIFKKYGYGAIDVHVYYATFGNKSEVGQETLEQIEKLKSEWSVFGFGKFTFDLLDAENLYDIWWAGHTSDRNIDQDINIIYDVNRASIIEFEAEDYKAVVCTVSGTEIARLASLEPKDAIFDMNLRGHLGMSGRVNSSILDACKSSSKAKTFWLKNNGITMVCSHLDISKDPDEPIVKVKNVQIVNGCQTSVTLREAAKQGVLDSNVKVLTKIYQLTDKPLINNIVLATNNQNSIVSRDLYANDECQLLIQQTIASTLGLFYEKKRGEARSNGRARTETIDSEKAGQALLAIKMKQPTVSRAQKYRIYENDLYNDIFRKSDPLHLALCYYLYECCKKRGQKRAKQLKKGDATHSLLTYGVFHLTRVFAYFAFSSESLPKDPDKIVQVLQKLRRDDKGFSTAFEKSVKLCSSVLKKAKAVSANNYFKSQIAQQQMTDAVSKV